MAPDPSEQIGIYGRIRGVLVEVNTVFTMVITAIVAVVSCQQQEIQNKIDNLTAREMITKNSTSLVKSAADYVDKVEEGVRKDTLYLTLLDIEKDIRASSTGSLSEQEIRAAIDLMPHHLALIVGDDEALAHLGGTHTEISNWHNIANLSGKPSVRRTAIRALARLAVVSRVAEHQQDYLKKIYGLSQDLTGDEGLREEAANALAKIAETYAGANIDEAVLKRLASVMREFEGTTTTIADHDVSTQDKDQSEPSSELTNEYISTFRSLRSSLEAEDKSKQNVAIDSLIARFTSDDTSIRRSARSEVADLGQIAVPSIFSAIEDAAGGPDEYRVSLGGTTALNLMVNDISIASISESELKTLIGQLGAQDDTLRKSTASFLAGLTDEQSVIRALAIIADHSKNDADLSNANLIYNGVQVLAHWALDKSVLPASLKGSVQSQLGEIDDRLRYDAKVNSRNWTKTLASITSS